MSTFDVPGANPDNKDALTPGCWAEHSDGRRLLIESVKAGRVSYLIFAWAAVNHMKPTPIGYRDEMPEEEFREEFTWKPALDKDGDYEEEEPVWIWHSKRPFPIASFSVVAN